MLHRTLVTLLIAAALLIALAGGLVLLAESEWAERRIEEHLSGRLQRSVVLEDIDLRFAWPPRVTLGAVRVDNPPWAQTAHLLDAQEVTLTAEFWPLLRGRVVLDQVALKKASVGLERDGARATWHIASETPIVIAGTFRDPTVRPKGAPLAARAAAAGLLAMVNPLLALVPLIEPGTAPESNCAQLLGEAKAAS